MPTKIKITHELLDRLPGSGTLHEEVLAQLIECARDALDRRAPGIIEVVPFSIYAARVEASLRAVGAREVMICIPDVGQVEIAVTWHEGDTENAKSETLADAIAQVAHVPLFRPAPLRVPVGVVKEGPSEPSLFDNSELARVARIVEVAIAEKKAQFASDAKFDLALAGASGTPLDTTVVPTVFSDS
jgi:hypothetical protein